MDVNKKVYIIFALLSIPTGILNYYLHIAFGTSIAGLVFMTVVFFLCKYVLQFYFNINQRISFWLKNGGTVYLLMTYIIWTLAFNIIGGL